jgi:hypothetical protein
MDADGPILRNLRQAMRNYGDPTQRFALHNREAALLILAANVRIDPRREWTKVEPIIRATLLHRFNYEEADLGQDVLLSDAIQTIHAIEGVVYVDVDIFDAVNQSEILTLPKRLSNLVRQPRIHVFGERVVRPETRSPNTVAAGAGGTGSAAVNSGFADVADAEPESHDAQPPSSAFRPAQVCFLPRDIPGALLLMQVL